MNLPIDASFSIVILRSYTLDAIALDGRRSRSKTRPSPAPPARPSGQNNGDERRPVPGHEDFPVRDRAFHAASIGRTNVQVAGEPAHRHLFGRFVPEKVDRQAPGRVPGAGVVAEAHFQEPAPERPRRVRHEVFVAFLACARGGDGRRTAQTQLLQPRVEIVNPVFANGWPAARYSAYHSSRVNVTSAARTQSRSRVSSIVPMTGCMRAG